MTPEVGASKVGHIEFESGKCGSQFLSASRYEWLFLLVVHGLRGEVDWREMVGVCMRSYPTKMPGMTGHDVDRLRVPKLLCEL